MTDPSHYEKIYSEMSTEDLIKCATTDREQYLDDCLEIIDKELLGRDIEDSLKAKIVGENRAKAMVVANKEKTKESAKGIIKTLVVVFLITFFADKAGRFFIRLTQPEFNNSNSRAGDVVDKINFINRNTPVYLDEITRVESVSRRNGTVVFNITVIGEGLDLSGVDQKEMASELKAHTLRQMRTQESGYETFYENNLILKFIYTVSGHDLQSIFTITPGEIDKSIR